MDRSTTSKIPDEESITNKAQIPSIPQLDDKSNPGMNDPAPANPKPKPNKNKNKNKNRKARNKANRSNGHAPSTQTHAPPEEPPHLPTTWPFSESISTMAPERRVEEMQKMTSFMVNLVKTANWGSRAPAAVAEMEVEVEGQERGAEEERLAKLVDAMEEDLRVVRGRRKRRSGEEDWDEGREGGRRLEMGLLMG